MLERKTTPIGADGAATVKSAQRILDIFELYASRPEPATLSSIASTLRMPKSSCLALLTTLASNGYIYEVRPQIGYYPTRRWLDKAQAISAHDPVVREVRPYLEALRDSTGETLILAKLVDRHILYIDVVESKQTLRYTAVAGQFKPLHGTASGRAALGALPREKREALLDIIDFVKLTPRTIVDRDALGRDIEEGTSRGWHVSRGENVADAAAIAISFVLMNEIFVLVVAGPTVRLEPNIETVGRELVSVRSSIEKT